MTLKSSEVSNCSWRISTVLVSFLVSSSCHAPLPLVVRPMKTVREMFLNRSISSRCTCFPWPRRWIIGEWIFTWFNISPNSSPNRNCSWGEAGKFSSLWFSFGLWSACKILPTQFERKLFELNFWNFLLTVQIHHKLVWSMLNSDQGVRIVSVHRHDSDRNSVLTVQATGCNFQYGPN